MEYAKCLVELDEVLNHVVEEEYQKLPHQLIETIKTRKDKQYEWTYDESKSLEEQNLNRKTIAMLAYLNMKYFVNEEERELLNKMHQLNEQNAERQKRKKYPINNMFKDREKIDVRQEAELINAENEKWYARVILFIKNLFNK